MNSAEKNKMIQKADWWWSGMHFTHLHENPDHQLKQPL